MELLEYENELYAKGYTTICGVDEAGRGPLAGPVCAGAVILKKGHVIKEEAVAYGIGWASVEEIEEINILNAAMLAMKRAVEQLAIKPDYALIDGNKTPELEIPSMAIVKGDSLSESIAAASILAKVSRDRLLLELAKDYPEYHFEKHKGYGTKLHREMILKYGPCEIHRPSFLKKILAEKDDV